MGRFDRSEIKKFKTNLRFLTTDPIQADGRNHPLFQAIQTHMETRPAYKRFAMPRFKTLLWKIFALLYYIWYITPLISNNVRLFASRNMQYILYFIFFVLGTIWILRSSFNEPNSKYNGLQSIYGNKKVSRIKAVDLWMTGISAKESYSILCAGRFEKMGRINRIMNLLSLIAIPFVGLYFYAKPLMLYAKSTSTITSVLLLTFVCFIPLMLSVLLGGKLFGPLTFHQMINQDVYNAWYQKKEKLYNIEKSFTKFAVTIMCCSMMIYVMSLAILFVNERLTPVPVLFYLISPLVLGFEFLRVIYDAVRLYPENLERFYLGLQDRYDEMHYSLVDKDDH